MRPERAALPLVAAALLAACATEAPRTSYDLGAADVRAKRAFGVALDAPSAAADLDSPRILVRERGDPLVLADAQWPRPLAALVAERVAQSLASPDGPPKVRLSLAIRRFELVAERRAVALEIEATVFDAANGRTLRRRDFRASAAVPSTRPPDVALGFDSAFMDLQRRIVAFAYDP